MTSDARDAALDDLIAEQAIRKVVYAVARGTDRRDLELVRSGYHPDAYDDHGGGAVEGRYAGPIDGFLEFLRANAMRYESSSHHISNVLVEREGDVAWVESYCLAVLRMAASDGGPALERRIICRYFDRFERRVGGWKISHRRVVYSGGREDVVDRDLPADEMGAAARSDASDPTYDRAWLTAPTG